MTDEHITVTEKTSLTLPSSLKSLLEALIFAAPEPVSVKELQSICTEHMPEGDTKKIEAEEIEQVIAVLNQECEQAGRPYRIVKIAGGYHYATLPDYAEWIGKLYKVQSRRKLSQSSIETLAIIAYRQPVSKPELESIRGVNCDYVLKTLLEKELVTIVGRAPTVGRPLLYGTTKEFLKHFGLNEISDLPKPREIEELLGDSRYETERRMLEAQEQALKEEKEEEDFKSRLPHIPRKKPELDESVKIIPKKKKAELKTVSVETDERKEEPINAAESDTDVASQAPPPDVREEAESMTVNRASTDTDERPQDLYEETPLSVSESGKSAESLENPNVTFNELIREDSDFVENSVGGQESSLADILDHEAGTEAPEFTVGTGAENRTDGPNELQQNDPEDVITEGPDVAALLMENSASDSRHSVERDHVDFIHEPQPSDEETEEVGPHNEENSSTNEIVVEPEVVDVTAPDTENSSLTVGDEPAVAASLLTQVGETEGSNPLANSADGGELQQQPKRKWQTWKEKIQGFIKKLFA